MQRLGPAIAVATGAVLAAVLLAQCALANDVPLPVKKPKDASGAALTKGAPATPAAPAASEHAAKPDPASPSAAKSASKKDTDKKPVAPDVAHDPVTAKTAEPATPSAGTAKTATGKPGAAPAAAGATPGTPAPAVPASNGQPAKPEAEPGWSAAEIEEARARCTRLLKGIDAVATPEPPLKDGICGAPAPVRLMSLGKNPQVSFDPPALLTCDMVASLATWINGDLQPLARKHLGAELVKVESMSDYSCRNAYGRKGNKLSEHGHANALDIRGFVTAKGEEAMVLDGWGTPQRVIVARVEAAAIAEAAAKAAAEKQKAIAEEAARAARSANKPAGSAGSDAAPVASGNADLPIKRSTIIEGIPSRLLPDRALPDAGTGLGLAPQRLGGPKEKVAEKPSDATTSVQKEREKPDGQATAKDGRSKDSEKKDAAKLPLTPSEAALNTANAPKPPARLKSFLHQAHTAACRIFGTTLGPEANRAHENHFHVDMAPRTHTKICD